MQGSASRLAYPSIALFFVFLAAWQWLPGALHVPEFILPTFSATWEEFVRMTTRDALGMQTAVTFLEVLVGFAIGSVLGAIFGYLLGLSPSAEFALSPYILALQIAPKVAFAPLFVMWLGFTVYPKILVAVLIVFFPVLINVLGAMRTIDPLEINLVRSLCATPVQMFWKVQFPATLPALFSGLRISSTLAVIGVLVGELVGGNLGLGYLLTYGQGQANTKMVFVTIILLTIIGIVLYGAVVLVERRALHYLPKAVTQPA
jgi:NitT/TauT family transport system permease protein